MRKIVYISGTRADFGLMEHTLRTIAAEPAMSLRLAVTGMHLSDKYGRTERDISAAGLHVDCRIPVDLGTTSGDTMARNIGVMLIGFTDYLSRTRPDIVLVLGDRGEMLAGALAAIHLNIAVAHVHGGERSGTVDEPVRHAISKLSHLHCVTTPGARERLIHMGERADTVIVTGAPGVEGIRTLATRTREDLCAELRLNPKRRTALFVFHPVVQEQQVAGPNTAQLLDLLLEHDLQIVALRPNSDAGGDAIAVELDRRATHPKLRVVTHFERSNFVSWMAAADLMIGNTSAGIIEAGSFGTPVINVGTRQKMRERNANVVDVEFEEGALAAAIAHALAEGRYPIANVYEQSSTARRITNLLRDAPLDGGLLRKINSY